VVFLALCILLFGGSCLIVAYLVSVPTATRRAAGVLGVGALAGFLVVCVWLGFLWAKWNAGYSCPDRGGGPGRLNLRGMEQADCGELLAAHQDAGWFFSPSWMAGAVVVTVAIAAVAVQLMRLMMRENGSTRRRVRVT